MQSLQELLVEGASLNRQRRGDRAALDQSHGSRGPRCWGLLAASPRIRFDRSSIGVAAAGRAARLEKRRRRRRWQPHLPRRVRHQPKDSAKRRSEVGLRELSKDRWRFRRNFPYGFKVREYAPRHRRCPFATTNTRPRSSAGAQDRLFMSLCWATLDKKRFLDAHHDSICQTLKVIGAFEVVGHACTRLQVHHTWLRMTVFDAGRERE